ncbi:hypothetical protein CVT24_001734 [Panaeolus cyanescens]|uniref:Uncharacterized protein n=1 Tax=Panaeolus cyanescens TaxID=181874 RepID=A0A409YFQ2_9AGAR|nr:hypothetical protein CVT24_001734 [Panaeolus cyanescens]
MLSASNPGNSHSTPTAGYVSIYGVVGLANPRVLSGTKTIVFDAQLYLGPGDDDQPRFLLGSLRYFNAKNLVFSESPQLYSIYSTFACKTPSAELSPSESFTNDEYCFVGDIQTIIPLGPPGPRFLAQDIDTLRTSLGQTESDCDDDMYAAPEIPTFEIDARQTPIVILAGVATNIQSDAGTFSLEIEQYISCMKSNIVKTSTTASVSSKAVQTTSFSCFIPDSPRYRNGKPMPRGKRYVIVFGFLTDLIASAQKRKLGLIDSFEVEVNNVVFCGQFLPPASNSSQSGSSKTPLKSANGTSKSLFSYNSPKTPITPTPSQGPRPLKRARMDDSESNSDSSKENVFS